MNTSFAHRVSSLLRLQSLRIFSLQARGKRTYYNKAKLPRFSGMSKAFTRESDSEPAQDSVPRRRLGGTGSGLITSGGAQRFRQELEQLIEQRRTAGDLPHPALQSRIGQLQEILQSTTVASLPADQQKIGFGANVRLRYSNGEETAFQIVGVDESDPAHDRISWQSPLARQLTGRRAGEKIRFRAPDGEQDLEILSVSYSPH